MVEYILTGEKKKVNHGLVDYVVPGYIERDGEHIPCEVGFTEFNNVLEATHIFITDGITNNGTHYCAETIEI